MYVFFVCIFTYGRWASTCKVITDPTYILRRCLPACGREGYSHLFPVLALWYHFFLSRCKFSTLTTRQAINNDISSNVGILLTHVLTLSATTNAKIKNVKILLWQESNPRLPHWLAGVRGTYWNRIQRLSQGKGQRWWWWWWCYVGWCSESLSTYFQSFLKKLREGKKQQRLVVSSPSPRLHSVNLLVWGFFESALSDYLSVSQADDFALQGSVLRFFPLSSVLTLMNNTVPGTARSTTYYLVYSTGPLRRNTNNFGPRLETLYRATAWWVVCHKKKQTYKWGGCMQRMSPVS